MITYFNTRTYKDVDIDIATCTLDEGLDYYASLMDLSDSHGAFPGSREWKKAQPHVIALRELIVARPDIEAERKVRRATLTAKRLEGVDVAGV